MGSEELRRAVDPSQTMAASRTTRVGENGELGQASQFEGPLQGGWAHVRRGNKLKAGNDWPMCANAASWGLV